MVGTVCTVGTVLGLTRQARKCTEVPYRYLLSREIRKLFTAFGNFLPDPDPLMAMPKCKNMNCK